MASNPKTTLAAKAAAKVPAFQIQVAETIGPYEAEAFLSRKDHICGYLRMLLNQPRGDDDKTTLDDDQILEGAKTVAPEGMSAEDRVIAILEYLQTLESTAEIPLADLTGAPAILTDQAADAAKYGAQLDDGAVAAGVKGVQGKKDYDGAPVMLESHLTRIFGDGDNSAMVNFPAIGSRRQGKKNDTVPFNMTKEAWAKATTPVDFYSWHDGTSGKDVTGRWLTDMINASSFGLPKKERIKMVRAIISDKGAGNVRNIPDDLEPIKLDTIRLNGELKDALADLTRFTDRVGRAIRLWQQKRLLKTLCPAIRFTLADGDNIEKSSQRNLPIALANRVKDKDTGEVEPVPAGRFSLTKFLNYKIEQAAANAAKAKRTVTTADLEATVKRDGKKKGATGATPTGGAAGAPAILTMEGLRNALSSVHVFTDKNEATTEILRSISKDGGGELASWVCLVADVLGRVASQPGVRDRANVYNGEQVAAQVDADLAKAKEAGVKLVPPVAA